MPALTHEQVHLFRHNGFLKLPGIDFLHDAKQPEWIARSGILEQGVPGPVPAGGMLAIDTPLFHRIGTNVTGKTRMSMTLGYQSVDELTGVRDPAKQLVSGAFVYTGNDGRTVGGNDASF